MKIISKREQFGNSFIAAPQHLMGAGRRSGNAFTGKPSSPSASYTRNSCMARIRKSVNDASIEGLQECRTETALSAQHPMVMAYIASCRPAYRLTHVSPQIINLGFPPLTWLAETDIRLRQVHKDDFDRVSQALRHSCRTGEKFNCYYRLYDSSGKMRWLHDKATVVRDASGAPLFANGTLLDITDMIKTELHDYRRSMEQQIEQRTESLMERIALLESLNTSLIDKLALTRSTAPGRAEPAKLPAATMQTSSANCTGHAGSASHWAQRMIALTRDQWIAHGGYKPKIKKLSVAQPTITTQLKSVHFGRCVSAAGAAA